MNKVLRTCIAMAAFAAFLVMPSIVLAANEATVTHPTGTTAPVGLNIIGTNKETNGSHVAVAITDVNGNVLGQCTTATITGELTKNTHEAVEVDFTSAEFKGTPGVSPHTSHCSSSFGTITWTISSAANGLPWCLRSTNAMVTNDEFEIRGGKCTEVARPIRFILHSSLAGECTYQRTPSLAGHYSTHPEDASLHVSKQEFPKVAGGAVCPSKWFLDLTLRLSAETSPGVETGLWISKVS